MTIVPTKILVKAHTYLVGHVWWGADAYGVPQSCIHAVLQMLG
jgi:hypothetical protein